MSSSSASAYSSPSTCSTGLQAHSSHIKSSSSHNNNSNNNNNNNNNPNNNNNNNNNNNLNPLPQQSISPNHPPTRTTYPTPPSYPHPQPPAPSNDPSVRRRAGLPYSSARQPPAHNPSRTTPSTSSNSPSRSLITVLPPESLPSNLSQVRSNSSSSSSSVHGPPARFRKGILVPLYPTLAAQLAAISREYGLPCAGGMVLYLVEGSSHTGEAANQLVDGPRISEEAWQILWSGVFEDEREEAFQNELQTKELYDDQDPLDTQPLRNHHRSYLGYDQSAEEEEVLNVGLEELINSGLSSNFPHPPLNSRPTHSAHLGDLSQEDLSSNSLTLSTEPSPISSSSSGRSEDLLKSNLVHNPRDSSSLDHKAHARSLSSMSNQLHSVRPIRVHSTGLPPRSSTSLSAQLPRHTSLRRIGLSSISSQRPASSDRGSMNSFYARPRRIGAGTIVGKIEFDIDRSRSSGRWYDLWLNPSSHNRSNPPNPYLPSDDHARPLLLPNLITQRKKSFNCLQDSQKRPGMSTHITEESLQVTSSNRTTPSENKSNSFLAFDDNHHHHLDTHSGFDSSNPGHTFYSNQDCDSKEQLFSHDSFTPQLHHDASKMSSQSTAASGEKRHLGSRIVNDQHRQAVATIVAQAKHQPSADQINSQLYSPIDLEFSPSHSYGLSLGVDSHLELADIRYTQNQDDMGCTFLSAPVTEPTTTTSMATSNQSTTVELPPRNESRVSPEHAPSKRDSSMAIKSNLDELEQALASLSPKALRYNAALFPMNPPSPALNSVPSDVIETRTSSLSWRKRTTNGSSGQQSQQSMDSLDEKNGSRGGFKIFETLQGSFNDSKLRSSQRDVPVGLTDGYTREDFREHQAPLSPVVTSRSFSPALKNMMRPNSPATKRSRDGFVTKAAGIMSGKFRHSGSNK